jgi:hypothetical protein
MAIPKRGRRALTILDMMFYWTVSVGKENRYVKLFVQHAENPAAKITATFTGIPGELSITPDIVRQVLETALKSGWNPINATNGLNIPMAQKLYPDAVPNKELIGA